MAENPKLAFLQNSLSVNGPTAPVEETALENLFFQRLITAGMTIDSAGNITAPFVTATPNVTNATGTLPVPHGGTGVTTLTGLVKGNGAAVMTAVAAPTGAVVGDADAQTLTNKTISGASNTLTVRAASDITGTLPHANGGTDNTHFTVTGPTADRSYAFPDASATVLTTNAAVTVAQGGTGVATLTAHGVVIGEGTSAVAVTAAGTAGQALLSGGAAADPSFQNLGVTLFDKSFTEQTVTNTSIETAIYSLAVAANTLIAARAMRLRVTGNIINTSGGSVNLTVKVALGATTIFNSGLTAFGTGLSVAPTVIEALINANNATNSQRAFAVWQYLTSNTADGAGTTPVTATQGGHSSMAVDMTTSQTLAVTVTWASAASTITFKRWAAVLELLQ